MTIRVSSKTLAAIDMIMGELRAMRREKITQDKAIWEMIAIAKPEIAQRVEELDRAEEDNEDKLGQN